jgi:hypothetical protein
LPKLDRFLVFRQVITVEGSLIGRKLDHHVARAGQALGILESSGPDQKTGSRILQGLGVGGNVGLVSLQIGDIDPHYPVTLGHLNLLSRTKQTLNHRLIMIIFAFNGPLLANPNQTNLEMRSRWHCL